MTREGQSQRSGTGRGGDRLLSGVTQAAPEDAGGRQVAAEAGTGAQERGVNKRGKSA